MRKDALPQLIDTLLRLSNLKAGQLRELIAQLPDPQAAAQEMVRRGWITQDQLSSLFPAPEQRPTPQETMLVGFGDNESPPDEDWVLPLSDDEPKADVPAAGKWVQPDRTAEEMRPAPETVAVPVLPLRTGQRGPRTECSVPYSVFRTESARRRESNMGTLLAGWMGWAGKGLLLCTLLFVGLYAGLQFFWASSTVLATPDKVSSKVAAVGRPAKAVDVPPKLPLVPVHNAKQPDDHPNNAGQNAQPAAPVVAKTPVTAPAAAPASDARPKSTASLYARIRQVVLENKTEETERLGIGDVAYQDVPQDGSIMVGMNVTYAPFFNHNIIKSVQPIYQRADGTRTNGQVCGTPTGAGDSVVAKQGYAIGAAAIRAGMGIDGMQLTFMEIGADGLNTHKSYLSKWLGGYGGAAARTFVNDGRPIIGIAGMSARNSFGPAFCLGLVTTRPGALADAAVELQNVPIDNTRQRDDLKANVTREFGPLNMVPRPSNDNQIDTAMLAVGSGIDVLPHPQTSIHVVSVVNGDQQVQVEYTLDEHGNVLASRKLPLEKKTLGPFFTQ